VRGDKAALLLFGEEHEIFMGIVEQFIKAKRITIFGASAQGRKALSFLERLSKRPSFFVDNDSEKWGKSVENLKVYPPEKLLERKVDAVIIASSTGEMEILSQLRKLGLFEKVYSMEFIEMLVVLKYAFGEIYRCFIEGIDR